MKYFGFLLLLLLPLTAISQDHNNQLETYPVFPECSSVPYPSEEICFNNTFKSFVLNNFVVPQRVIEEDYTGEMTVLFEVNQEGEFRVLYIEAIYEELKEEIRRVFSALPVVEPPTYNGKPTYAQFRMPLRIPLVLNKIGSVNNSSEEGPVLVDVDSLPAKPGILEEYDAIVSKPFKNREYNSNLNIPLSHERYSRFDAEMNQIGTNSHTASKPFLYKDVNRYYNFEAERAEMHKNTSTWLGRKLWNEHLVTFQGENYWFTGDLVLDLQLGKDMQSDFAFKAVL